MPEPILRHYAANAVRITPAGFSKVFDNFSTAMADRTGADIVDINSARRAGLVSRKYPLWTLTQDNVPISAIVSYEGGDWFAEIDWLNVVGVGETPNDAVHELEAQIIYFMDFYQNQPEDELTRYAGELKAYFATLVHDR